MEHYTQPTYANRDWIENRPGRKTKQEVLNETFPSLQQTAGDQESVSGSLEDNSPSVAGDDPPEQGVQDHMFEGKDEGSEGTQTRRKTHRYTQRVKKQQDCLYKDIYTYL